MQKNYITDQGSRWRLEWLRLVEKVKESIKQKPQQRLGDDLPSPDELNVIIDEIFQNFLRIEILLS